jgi:YD repeat-containing protein
MRLWITLIGCLLCTVQVDAQISTNARSGRFTRGTGDIPQYQSFVIPLDFQKGIALDPIEGNATNLFSPMPWTATRYHYNATNLASATNYQLRIPYRNPIVAFGGRVGGSPLYLRQKYDFGVYAGQNVETGFSDIAVDVLYRTNMSLAASVEFYIPVPWQTNEWRQFATNGYSVTANTNGLTTTVRLLGDFAWGIDYYSSFILTHEGDESSTNYVYVVYGLGYNDEADMVVNDQNAWTWQRLYTVEFEPRPATRSIFIDQPHFQGTPLPPEYVGKSVQELTNLIATVTNQVWLTNSASYVQLDQSPELRKHPILDKFVSDMKGDALALTTYVLNEIELTDAMSHGESGIVPYESVNLGGVNRSALSAFLEKRGSPWEQCALLVYLLRAAGHPAAYAYPTNSNLKMLDVRLSKLMRMQLKGAVNRYGELFSANSLITVNYPWVVANINSNRVVHIFPWLKDTEIVEGFDFYHLMPAKYNSGQKWVRQYLYGDTNILGFSSESDVPLVLLPKFIQAVLRTNAPGLSVDDIGVRMFDRRNQYVRWEDIPRPNVLDNPTQAVVIADLATITNQLPGMSRIFDTVKVEIYRGSTKIMDTGEMRSSDIHGRKFLVFTNSGKLKLWLAPYRPSITNQSNFTNDAPLLNRQLLENTLQGSDNEFKMNFTHQRHRGLTNAMYFYDVTERRTITNQMTLKKSEVVGICTHFGAVTPEMLQPHAQDYWAIERRRQTNSSYVPATEDYQGTAAYLMGMSYFEKDTRFTALSERLHKVRLLTGVANGLAVLEKKVVSGNVKVRPRVDMLLLSAVIAGNSTLHGDSGMDFLSSYWNHTWMTMGNGSAEEHHIINGLFGEQNAISTVKLLQLAQRRSTNRAGIVELDKNNHAARGNQASTGYGPTWLKNYDTALWQAVTNYFKGLDGDFAVAYVTPAAITNDTASYEGMGAFTFSAAVGWGALISANQNGGSGSYVSPFDVTSNDPWLPYSLETSADGSYVLQNNDPSYMPVTILSPADVATVTADGWNLFPSLFLTGASEDTANILNLADQSFRSTAFAGQDSGNAGFPQWLNVRLLDVADPVNSMTGQFYIDATDLTLEGPMPLQVRRSYLSQNRSDNQFGVGWKMNYLPYLVVTTNASNVPLLYAAEMDGAVVVYRKDTNDVWRPQPQDNPTLSTDTKAGIGSLANMFNARIERLVTNSIETYYFRGPDGSVRRYETSSAYAIASGTNNLDRTRPYLREWKDNKGNYYTFSYGTDPSAPDYGQIARIDSSNGGFLGFRYDVYGHIIAAYTGDGRRLYYDYDQFGDLVRVTLPDASKIEYEYQHYTFNTTNGGTVRTNLDSHHLLVREVKEDGRTLENFYDNQRRVIAQKATVGADLNTYTNAVFTYSNNFSLTNAGTNLVSGYTLVADAYNRVTRYDYTNGLLTKVTDPLGQTIEQQWYADNAAAPGYRRSLFKSKDKRDLWTEYKYNELGNITNITVTGDLTGNGNTNEQAVTTAKYNSDNLLTEMVTPGGNTNRQFYTNTWLLSRVEVHPTNSTATSIVTNTFTYYNVTNLVTNGTTLLTNIALGMRQRGVRAFGTSDAATNEWAYDGRGFLIQEVYHTGTSDPAVTNQFLYNGRGELAESTDAAGRKAKMDYDGLGRPKYREIYEANATVPVASEYFYYNAHGELVWRDGPRYGPEDYVWNDYDGAGRPTQQITWKSRAKADGTGVEAESGDDLYVTTFSEYDLAGNLTRTIDPQGNYTTNSYDTLNRRVQQRFFDSTTGTFRATNGFGYEAGGEVAVATNALGGVTEKQYTSTGKPKYQKNPDSSTNAWRYYVDGRLHKEILANGNYLETSYDDATRKVTKVFRTSGGTGLATNVVENDRRGNAIRIVDAAGFATTNIYDGLDRPRVKAGPVMVYEPPPGAPALPGGLPPPVQQATTNYYGLAEQVVTNVNALGEKAITYTDALGRPTRKEIRSVANVVVRETSYTYGADHHSVTETNGSGATAIASTTYTDTDGKPVLSISYPAAGVLHFTRREYDRVGNLEVETVNSKTNSTLTVWQTRSFTYDGLNRLRTKTEKDGALTTYDRDAGGNVTNQSMPSGLSWRAEYDSAGRITKDYDISGSTGANTNTYAYYGGSSPFAGRLQTKTDGRGVTCSYGYDAYLHMSTNTHSGSSAEHSQTTIWSYDVRGYVTNISESFANSSNGPSTKVVRSFNAYGQTKTESVYIGAFAEYGSIESWDSAGRRRQLGFGGFGTTFGWNADGTVASVTDPSGGASYGYETSGQLRSRSVGSRLTTIAQRDGAGRILVISNTISGNAASLTETLTWTGDGLPATASMARTGTGAFTDDRSYFYTNQSRRLIEERLGLDGTKRWTNNFVYDNGSPAGAGVLTKAGTSWSGATNALLRIVSETNSARKVPAWGTNNGLATVSTFLDGLPVPVTQTGTNLLFWRSTMEVLPGAHQLKVAALHPSQLYTAYATNYFTNSGPAETISGTYDGSGRITSRVWKTGSTTNRTETWSWDGKGRLWKVVQRDSTQSGFDETYVYDPLGRRLQTSKLPYTNGSALSNSVIVTKQVFDPEHEFLELGVSRNGAMTWKLYGPDLNGVYGGLNGLGGFEAIIPRAELFCPVIGDSLGNIHGIYDQDHGSFEWFTSRVTAFGAVPGYKPVPFAEGAMTLAHSSAWRGKWLDTLDRAQWGVRPYLMDSATFASPDSLGHEGNENLYTAFNGRPDFFDIDGRCSTSCADPVQEARDAVSKEIAYIRALGEAQALARQANNEWLAARAYREAATAEAYDRLWGTMVAAGQRQAWQEIARNNLAGVYQRPEPTWRDDLSYALDITPGISTIKSIFQTPLGIDLITGKEVSRTWNAINVGLSLAPVSLVSQPATFGVRAELAFAGSAGARLAAKSGVATATDQAVFWSGRQGANFAAAREFAEGSGRLTLEMTPGGQALPAFSDATRPLWEAASRDFAGGASGTVNAFTAGSRANSIWNTIEKSALLNNPNVIKINVIDQTRPWQTKIIYPNRP